MERLKIWCTVGRDRPHGKWALLGARMGCHKILLEEFSEKTLGKFFIQQDETEIEVPLRLLISEVNEMEVTDKNILYADKSTLKYPLVVRKWKKGDYFYPFGMSGRKKLSKYFKDEKVDIISKGKQWLLCSGDEIVWVIGKRTDQRFSVTEKTKKIVKFTVHT